MQAEKEANAAADALLQERMKEEAQRQKEAERRRKEKDMLSKF